MSNHKDNDKLIAEFLAKGGEIRQMKRGARTEIIEPLKRRGMMGRKPKVKDPE
jgi:hypothetical protein